jgi:hypothetical protein
LFLLNRDVFSASLDAVYRLLLASLLLAEKRQAVLQAHAAARHYRGRKRKEEHHFCSGSWHIPHATYALSSLTAPVIFLAKRLVAPLIRWELSGVSAGALFGRRLKYITYDVVFWNGDGGDAAGAYGKEEKREAAVPRCLPAAKRAYSRDSQRETS